MYVKHTQVNIPNLLLLLYIHIPYVSYHSATLMCLRQESFNSNKRGD